MTPQQDSWYVVIAMGNDDLAPVFTPVDIMPVQLQDIVDGAVAEIGALGENWRGWGEQCNLLAPRVSLKPWFASFFLKET